MKAQKRWAVLAYCCLLLIGWMENSACAQSSGKGSSKFREKARKLAEVFPRESRSDVDFREHGIVAYADRKPRVVGDVDEFFCDKADDGKKEKISAVLKAIGTHCYVYLEKGKSVPNEKIAKIVSGFDSRVYPINTAWFGQEWNPGVDGDPKITLLLVDGLEAMDGFFDPEDEYTREKCPGSNEREMLTLAISRLDDVDEFLGHLVAHEFQHMIHWNHDPKEANWIDEGCAEFAASLFDRVPFTAEKFFLHPQRCLIDWDDSEDSSNYGHVFLFMNYFITHYARTEEERRKLVRAIVASRRTSVSGIDEAMQQCQIPVTIADVFRNFTAATYLNKANDEQAGTFAFEGFTGRTLADLKKNPVQPVQTFAQPEGRVKGKVKMWSSQAVAFNLSKNVTALSVDFAGKTFEAGKGRNAFDIGVAFIDKDRAIPPFVVWGKPKNNSVEAVFEIPRQGFEKALVIICNRGPGKFPANEKQWPAVAFSIQVGANSSQNAERARFEKLHSPRCEPVPESK